MLVAEQRWQIGAEVRVRSKVHGRVHDTASRGDGFVCRGDPVGDIHEHLKLDQEPSPQMALASCTRTSSSTSLRRRLRRVALEPRAQ